MKKIHLRLPLLLLLSGLIASCANVPAPVSVPAPVASCPVCEPCRKCAEAPPVSVVPVTVPVAPPLQMASFDELPDWQTDDLAAAWPSFLLSCRALKIRPQWLHWQASCEAAQSLGTADSASVRRFFETRFTPWALTQPDGSREGLVTGYYEPILKGSRTRTDKARHPVLGVPADLLTIDFGDLYPELRSLRLRGRVEGNKVIPYFPRAEIRQRESGTLAGNVLAWVEDPVELFFLHVQGSGRIALPDGGQLRLGYADQNGYAYQSIGKLLIERGDLKPEQASMQGIQAWARANPDKLNDLLDANPSFVFFRELPAGEGGPPGALGVPLLAERTVAIDPRTTPLGAPVFLATTVPNGTQKLNRLMLAQDTGGAIKGVVRADFFFGLGAEAGQKAGRMKQKGKMWVLLPNGYPLPPVTK